LDRQTPSALIPHRPDHLHAGTPLQALFSRFCFFAGWQHEYTAVDHYNPPSPDSTSPLICSSSSIAVISHIIENDLNNMFLASSQFGSKKRRNFMLTDTLGLKIAD
jgi:hypothetical protein